MATKGRTAKAAAEPGTSTARGGGLAGTAVFLTGAFVVAYLFRTNPDPKSFEAYRLVNTGLCLWLPLLVILFVLRAEPGQFGLTRGDWRLGQKWALIAWIAMLLPIAYYAQRGGGQEYYLNGRLRADLAGTGPVFDGRHVYLQALVYYEMAMGFYMFCWEFFFRGFLLFGLQRTRLGTWGAVIVQALLFMLLHWSWQKDASKPLLEVLSALPGGLILGIFALRTRSFIYGYLIHWSVSLTLDLFLLAPFMFKHFG